MQAVDVILDQDDEDIDENAGGAVVINMGGPGHEDGMIQPGTDSLTIQPFVFHKLNSLNCYMPLSWAILPYSYQSLHANVEKCMYGFIFAVLHLTSCMLLMASCL